MRNPLTMLTNLVPTPYVGKGESRTWNWGLGRNSALKQMRAMGQNGTLFSIVNRITTTTASVEWHMHRERPRASVTCSKCGEPGVELVTKHRALVTLNEPNSFFDRVALFESVGQHVELTGEGWMVISRIGDIPYELWPVRPDRMEPVTSPEHFLLGYVYTGPTGEQVPLDRRDVLFQRMPNPVDSYRGMGAVQAVMNTLDSVKYSGEWNNAFFRNNARPGGLIKISGKMQDREWRKFQERWAESHQGVSNAGRVGMLEGGAEWVDAKYTQRDMQFFEISQLDKATIREAFGMPKFAVGDVEDVNRATADASKAWYAEAITVPRLDRWKGLLNNQYLPQFPDLGLGTVSLVYTSPVPADREAERDDLKAKAEVYKTLVDAGVHPDDAAIQAGLPPMRTTAPQQQDNNFGAELRGSLA